MTSLRISPVAASRGSYFAHSLSIFFCFSAVAAKNSVIMREAGPSIQHASEFFDPSSMRARPLE